MAKLGEICKFQSGGTPSKTNDSFYGGSIPWITTVALNDSIIDADNAVDWITEEAISKSAAKIVPKDSIMIGTRVGVGKTAVNRVAMSTSQDIISLLDIDESKWNKHFLCLFFVSKREFLLSQARGATIKGIKIDTIADLDLPNYSLETQKQIAATLDKATHTIDLCNAILEKLDFLVKARFVEMFGSKEYPHKELISLIIEGAGLSYGIVVPGVSVENGVPMIRPSDFKNGVLDLSNLYKVAESIECKYARTRLLGNEILVQVIGQPGQVMITDSHCKGMNVTRNLAVVRPDCKLVNRTYLYEYLKKDESQRFMTGETNQSTLKQLPLNKLKQLRVFLPSLELQEQFAAFVAQTDKTKAAVQQVLSKAETLKKALMQEYFG